MRSFQEHYGDFTISLGILTVSSVSWVMIHVIRIVVRHIRYRGTCAAASMPMPGFLRKDRFYAFF